jgi:uncharacterized protein YrrD
VPDPVAWTVIEPGWRVVDAGGNEVGRVHEVLDDLNLDIFDGLTVKRGVLSRDKYVPAEHVDAIYEGEVHLSISLEEIEALGGR